MIVGFPVDITCIYIILFNAFCHLNESVGGKVSLEHAPGAGQILVREDQETLARPENNSFLNR